MTDEGSTASQLGPRLFNELGRASHRVADIIRLHVADNEELLPILLLGEVADWYVVERVDASGLHDSKEHEEVVTLLGAAYVEGTSAEKNDIAAGFLEPLLSEPGEFDELPESLREKLAAMRTWSP